MDASTLVPRLVPMAVVALMVAGPLAAWATTRAEARTGRQRRRPRGGAVEGVEEGVEEDGAAECVDDLDALAKRLTAVGQQILDAERREGRQRCRRRFRGEVWELPRGGEA